jgi:hypothetical protein
MTAEPEMILELPAKSGCARESAFSETEIAQGHNCSTSYFGRGTLSLNHYFRV